MVWTNIYLKTDKNNRPISRYERHYETRCMLGWLGGKQTVVSAICEFTTLNFPALRIYFILTGKSDHCAVWGCGNDRRYPEKYVVKDHIAKFNGSLSIPFWSCKPQHYSTWSRMISREVVGKGSRKALFQVGKYTKGLFQPFCLWKTDRQFSASDPLPQRLR